MTTQTLPSTIKDTRGHQPAPVTVVGLGCELDRLYAGQPPALPVPGAPERDDLRDLFDTLAGPLRGGRSVILVVGDWLPAQTLERVHMVHSLLQTDRVAIHVTDLPPLAASVLAALTAALAPHAVSAGALAGSLDALSRQLPVLAWLSSVAGLRHPAVSLFHHARSALPWASFGVGLQPDPFVIGLHRAGAQAPIEPPSHPVDLLVAPREEMELSWMLEYVAPALGGAEVRQLPPTLHGAAWWGTSRLVEAVGVPRSLDWLAAAVLPKAVAQCAWCEEPIAATPCPFCGDASFRFRRQHQRQSAR